MRTPGRSSALVKVAVAIFAVGLVAVAAVFVCFTAGLHDLPLWLNLTAGLGVPIGLLLGLVGLVREARQDARTGAAQSDSDSDSAESETEDADAEASSVSSEPNTVSSESTNSAPAARN
jgi:hypothetical protein